MKLKLKLVPDPTFEAVVDIPVHGGAVAPVKFKFRHRSRSAYKEWAESLTGKKDIDLLLDIAVGWDLDEEFNRENAERLLENYAGSGQTVFNAYNSEIFQARIKN